VEAVSDELDPRIKQRQMTCKHAMIKPFPTSVERCVHCGVSAADWKVLHAEMPMVWGMP